MATSAENTKTGIEKLLDGHLKGLILPDNSVIYEFPLWTLLAISAFVLLLLLSIWYWYKKRNTPQQIARRKLVQLLGFLHKSQNRQAIAIQLSSTLRQGLQATRLELYQAQNPSRWQAFLSELEIASYSSEPPTQATLEDLFKHSHEWLKH